MKFNKLGITPGPWFWEGRESGAILFGEDAPFGYNTVMDFVRKGMQDATCRFPDQHNLMYEPHKKNKPDYSGNYKVNSPNAVLISKAPELLEALIESTMWMEDALELAGGCDHQDGICYCVDFDRLDKHIKLIESATGKTWEQVKEAFDE